MTFLRCIKKFTFNNVDSSTNNKFFDVFNAPSIKALFLTLEFVLSKKLVIKPTILKVRAQPCTTLRSISSHIARRCRFQFSGCCMSSRHAKIVVKKQIFHYCLTYPKENIKKWFLFHHSEPFIQSMIHPSVSEESRVVYFVRRLGYDIGDRICTFV